MIFSRASLVLALSLVLSVSARPFGKRWGPWGDSWGGGSWSPGSWGGDDEQHHSWTPTPTSSYPWDLLKRHGEYKAAHCDLQNAIQYMNLTAGMSNLTYTQLTRVLTKRSLARFASSKSQAVSNHCRSRNSKLHMRPCKRNRNPRSNWRTRIPIRCELHGSQSQAALRHHANLVLELTACCN